MNLWLRFLRFRRPGVAAMRMTDHHRWRLSDHDKIALAIRLRTTAPSTWRLLGYDTYDHEYYPYDGAYASQAGAEAAAQMQIELKRLDQS